MLFRLGLRFNSVRFGLGRNSVSSRFEFGLVRFGFVLNLDVLRHVSVCFRSRWCSIRLHLGPDSIRSRGVSIQLAFGLWSVWVRFGFW